MKGKWYLLALIFLFGGTVSVFSQQTLASFGFGGQFLDLKIPDGAPRYNAVITGTTLGVNILFVGKTGFAISTEIDANFNFYEGVNIDPVLGLGYVYYNVLYLGGIFNVIPKQFIPYNFERYRDSEVYYNVYAADVFIVPTFVAGFDFGSFLLGGQLSYMRGVNSGINGFRFLIGAGVNVGSLR
jgi:hypothetical protein